MQHTLRSTAMTAAGVVAIILARHMQHVQHIRNGWTGTVSEGSSADIPHASDDDREVLLGERVDFLLRGQPSLHFQHRRAQVEDCLVSRARPRGGMRCGRRAGPGATPTGA